MNRVSNTSPGLRYALCAMERTHVLLPGLPILEPHSAIAFSVSTNSWIRSLSLLPDDSDAEVTTWARVSDVLAMEGTIRKPRAKKCSILTKSAAPIQYLVGNSRVGRVYSKCRRQCNKVILFLYEDAAHTFCNCKFVQLIGLFDPATVITNCPIHARNGIFQCMNGFNAQFHGLDRCRILG
jgi:hypothetical protein